MLQKLWVLFRFNEHPIRKVFPAVEASFLPLFEATFGEAPRGTDKDYGFSRSAKAKISALQVPCLRRAHWHEGPQKTDKEYSFSCLHLKLSFCRFLVKLPICRKVSYVRKIVMGFARVPGCQG